MKNKKAIWIALAAFVLIVGLMVGIYLKTRPQPQPGAKTVNVTVVHKDDTQKHFIFETEELYLAPLLIAEGLLTEDAVQNGMIDTVDGETAVWAEDEGWWCIYVDGEMATLGVSEIPLTDGGVYRLEYTNGYAG